MWPREAVPRPRVPPPRGGGGGGGGGGGPGAAVLSLHGGQRPGRGEDTQGGQRHTARGGQDRILQHLLLLKLPTFESINNDDK